MNIITEAIKEMERQDRVNDIDLSGVVEILHEADKAYNKALTIPAVVGRSEQYCDCSQRSLMKPISPTEYECFDCGKEVKQ